MTPSRIAFVALGLVLAACGGTTPSPSAPTPVPPVTPQQPAAVPGFDIGLYPGDGALRAWKYPSSPYKWVGYYLAAPCHRDTSWMGRRSFTESNGWGIAALYVGQQDWNNIPANARANRSVIDQVTCSASLLSDAQGTSEALDAADKMKSEGFPLGSIIYVDVELVTTVTPDLVTYYRAWLRGVLSDGRYLPGVYAAKSNAQRMYDEAVSVYQAAGRTDTPRFWIASSTGFSLNARPTDVGLPFAHLWQGRFDVAETWNGVTLRIDQDISMTAAPSAP